MKIIELFAKRPLFVNLISLFIIVAGFIATTNTSREAFPSVDFETLTILTVYPNATPKEVEKLVTIPLEDEIFEVNGIKEMSSISAEGMSTIVIELDPNVKDKQKVVNDIQRAVDRVNDLPDDAEDPIINEANTDETPIIQVSLSGNLTEEQLRHYAESLEDKLIELPGISSIEKAGWRDPEIWIEVDPQKSADYYLALTEVMESVAKHNISLPGGTMGAPEKEYLVRTVGEFEDADEIKKVVVRANDLGNWIRVEDIAEVKNTFKDDSIISRANGFRAINLICIKRSGYDAIDTVDQIKSVCKNFQEVAPSEITLAYVDDMSYFIRRRLSILINNSIIGIILVIVTLALFMNWRIALLTALGLPIAFGATLWIMNALGISLNLISMFAMIIVVGLVVDDAIIISENAFRYIEDGYAPIEAAVIGTKQVTIPVIVTILTTILAFVPLLLMTGIMGKFIRHIPIVVSLALTASLLEALFILPSHIAEFSGKPKKQHKESHWFQSFLESFKSFTATILKFRYPVIVIGILTLVGALVLAKTQMKFKLFTAEGVELFYVRVETPIGTSKEYTEKVVMKLEKIIQENLPTSDLKDFVTAIGIMQQDAHDPFTQRGSHLAQITVFTHPANKCQLSIAEMIRILREKTKDFKDAEIRFMQPNPGPPVGRPVAIRIKGNDFESIQKLVHKFEEQIKKIPGIIDMEDDYTAGKDELRIIVNEEKATQAFLAIDDIARAVNAAFAGGIATNIKTTSDEIDIRVKFPETVKSDLNSFDKILIKNSRGNLIPFNEIAHIEKHNGVTAIKHLDKKRVINILADVDDEKITSIEANKILNQEYENFKEDFIENTVVFGGEQEDTQESMDSLFKAFFLSAFSIFLVLATAFQSLLQPLIIMLAIPFGIVGVIFTFYLHNLPLGFMNMLGMIGLSGIVVNDSIVLIEFTNKLRESGLDLKEAIINASAQRLRPILLTTLTTSIGLMPTAYGWGGNDPFIKPMALTIAWGIVFATAITLVFIPCVYYVLENIKIILFGQPKKKYT